MKQQDRKRDNKDLGLQRLRSEKDNEIKINVNNKGERERKIDMQTEIDIGQF